MWYCSKSYYDSIKDDLMWDSTFLTCSCLRLIGVLRRARLNLTAFIFVGERDVALICSKLNLIIIISMYLLQRHNFKICT